eukprot:gene5100-5605_t
MEEDEWHIVTTKREHPPAAQASRRSERGGRGQGRGQQGGARSSGGGSGGGDRPSKKPSRKTLPSEEKSTPSKGVKTSKDKTKQLSHNEKDGHPSEAKPKTIVQEEEVVAITKNITDMVLTPQIPPPPTLPSDAETTPAVNNPPQPPAAAVKAWTSGYKLKIQPDDPVSFNSPSASTGDAAVAVSRKTFLERCKEFSLTVNHSMQSAALPIRGLQNTGCACFRNCILQALLALPAFIHLLDYLSSSVSLEHDLGSFPIWRELLAFYEIFSEDSSNGRTMTRSSMAADLYMSTTFTAFQGKVEQHEIIPQGKPSRDGRRKGSQQDALEFLTFLLDELHEEVFNFITADEEVLQDIKPLSLIEIGDGEAVEEEDDDEGWTTVNRKDRQSHSFQDYKVEVDEVSQRQNAQLKSHSPVAAIFHGCLRSEVLYRSRKVCSVTFQQFHALTLHLPSEAKQSQQSLLLEDLIQQYFQIEQIDEGLTLKFVRLERLPEVLILQIARFSFDFERLMAVKIHHAVEYPVILNLPGNIISGGSRSGGASYRLHAVVLHHGKKATGGHYSTYICHQNKKEGSGEWNHLNDTKHSAISEAQALSGQELVYLLFYSRIHN